MSALSLPVRGWGSHTHTALIVIHLALVHPNMSCNAVIRMYSPIFFPQQKLMGVQVTAHQDVLVSYLHIIWSAGILRLLVTFKV